MSTLSELKGKPLVAALEAASAANVTELALEQCTLTGKPLAALTTLPFPALKSLSLERCKLSAPMLEQVCTAPSLAGVEQLSLRGNTFGTEGAKLFARGAVFEKLTALDVGYTRLDLEGVQALVEAPVLKHLERWRSSTDKVGMGLGEALAKGKSLANLKVLVSFSQKLTNGGLEKLFDGPVFQLRSLVALEQGIGKKGVKAIAQNPAVSELRDLAIRYDPFDDECLLAIAESPMFAKLERLQASQCRVTHEGVRDLSESKHVQNLVALDLSTNPIGAAGMHAFMRPAFAGLRELKVGGTHLHDAGIDVLAADDAWPRLESLSLQQNRLTDHGLEALAKWEGLSRLNRLELGTNDISDAGLKVLLDTGKLRNLESLELYQTKCGDARALLDAAGLQKCELVKQLSHTPWWTEL